MDAFIIMLKNVIVFIALAIPGYLLIKCKVLKNENSVVLSKILSLVAMPFLIISGTLSINFNGETITNLVWAGVLGVIFTFILFFLSKITATKSFDKNNPLGKDKIQGMERFCAIFPNNGFLGIPLAIAVFGSNSLIVAYLVIVNIVNNTLIYTLGVYLISGDKKSIDIKKILLNPVLLGFIAGLILNLTKVTNFLPEVATYSEHFKNLITPISMTILGMKMGNIRFGLLFSSWKMYYVSFIKLIIGPVLTVGITMALCPLLNIDRNMIMSMFMAFSISTAALSTAIADTYDGDIQNGTIYTLGSTVLSIITIPLLYLVLCLII